MFGGAASEERIREEMLGYSDYQIHRLCLGSGSKRIARRQLPPDAVSIPQPPASDSLIVAHEPSQALLPRYPGGDAAL